MRSNRSWKLNWQSAIRLIVVCSLSLIVSNCASGGIEPITRNLPATPGFAQPVSVPEPRNKEDMLAIAARERAGRKRANTIIVNFRNWYGGVRKSYGAK